MKAEIELDRMINNRRGRVPASNEKEKKLTVPDVDFCLEQNKQAPSIDDWLREAKQLQYAGKIGMYLIHNGVVRKTARRTVREGVPGPEVTGMVFDYDKKRVKSVIDETYRMEGIYHIRVWLNRGILMPGDDLMYVLVGGDTRPHIIEGFQFLIGALKSRCVVEKELYQS